MASFILDTNIVQYSSSRGTSIPFTNLLADLDSQGHSLYFSEYSIFELLRGAKLKTETELVSILDKFKKYPVDTNILLTAAQLETVYRMESIPCEKISDGDKIIAATSIITNNFILTTNGRDFPWPYFIEQERTPLVFNENHYSKTILVATFSPDLNLLMKRFSERG
ncbi:PIN domain-containing protein [Candidatus Shapirobacteria bacterium]|nr:PIN domain-containing protein [Candidatus Shapirobacteria bacterium]